MKFRTALGLTVLTVAPTASACLSAGVANAATPNCGGQNAAPQPVPYTCSLPGIDITYQGVTRHFSAQVVANGTTVTVTYLMTGGVLPVDVPIRIVHHEGISGAGGSSNESSGVIPAGKVTATLTDSAPCRNGQLDVKAVNTSNGSGDAYRVGGPWIQNGTNCTGIPTTTSPTTTTPSSSTTVPPATTTTPVPPSTVETSAPTTRPPGSTVAGGTTGTLPPTGNGSSLPVLAFFLVGVGVSFLIVAVARRQA